MLQGLQRFFKPQSAEQKQAVQAKRHEDYIAEHGQQDTRSIDIVIIENVSQLLKYDEVMAAVVAAFDAAGFSLRLQPLIAHNAVGGSSYRVRVFLCLHHCSRRGEQGQQHMSSKCVSSELMQYLYRTGDWACMRRRPASWQSPPGQAHIKRGPATGTADK